MDNVKKLLTALINGEKVDIKPRSRIEAYLKNCCEGCGCDGLPAPITETDALLYALAEKLAGGGSGGAEVKTCNVTFKRGEFSFGDPKITYYACSRLVNGKIENVSEGAVYGNGDSVAVIEPNKPFTLENVVCGTTLIFYLSFSNNGHEVVFDENYVRCLNDDYEFGWWAISPDATDFDFEINAM